MSTQAASADPAEQDEDIDEALQDAVSDGEGRLMVRYVRHHLAKRGYSIIATESATAPVLLAGTNDGQFIDEATGYPTLGPNYYAARAIAERFTAMFEAEHFKSLLDDFTKQFRDMLGEQVIDRLMEDAETGLQHAIWYRLDRSVEALLGGEQWAMEKYCLGPRYDAEKIRAAVAKHIPGELQDKRIADLEAQLAEANNTIDSLRRYR